MAGRKIGIGLVGCGVIAPHHLEGLAHIGSAELIATADVIPERAREMAEKYGARCWYTSYDDLLADERVELVNVAWMLGPATSVYGLVRTRTHRMETENLGKEKLRCSHRDQG